MHTHKNSEQSKTKAAVTNTHIDIPTIESSQGPKIEMTAIVPSSGGNGGEEYHKRSPQDDPVLRRWLLTKGIDITNMDSIASHITPEDLIVGEMSESDLNQWKEEQYGLLIAKRRRKDNNKWRIQASQRDKELELELRKIKQHLNHTDSIKERDHVHVDQIYKAWTKATGKRDRQRVFKNRLYEYIDSGYFAPLDNKHMKFRAEDKLMVL